MGMLLWISGKLGRDDAERQPFSLRSIAPLGIAES